MKNEELRKTYNKIAQDWGNDHSGDTWWLKGANKFLEFLPVGSKVLDLGCGSGYKTAYIKEKGYDVEGCDFSEGMVELSKNNFPDINFEVFDLYDLDKMNKKFDGIFCQAVLLHIPKKDIFNILNNMKSLLNDNGYLYIAVKEKRDSESEEEIVKENDYGYDYERFFSYFTISEFKDYFNKLNMKVVYLLSEGSSKRTWINLVAKK